MKNILIALALILISLSYTHAQCFPDRHNTTWFDAWISCDIAPNPNSSREAGHWIMYDLGRKYIIKDLHLWNLNVPGRTNQGVKTIAIDLSDNGTDWVEAGTFGIDSADATSTYQGSDIDGFLTSSGQFMLITVLETWGGDCAGFSELRMHVEPKIITAVSNPDELQCQPNNNGIKISWSPSSNNEVVLQRSEDGMKWQNISLGQPSVKDQKYAWHDKKATHAYYRLKKQNINGAPTYSKVHFCSRAQLTVEVWPNPVKHIGYIKIGSTSAEPIQCSIEDALGHRHFKQTINSSGYITSIDIGALELRPGTYTVMVEQGHQIKSLKIVKL